MAKYSPIAPLSILHQLQERDLLGNYLLLLAHEVLKDPRGYIDLIAEVEDTEANSRHIIIDNGVIELGEALPIAQVIDAACLVEADCVIMPDVLGDFVATQKAVIASSPMMRNCGFDIMKLPQGSNVGDLVQCVDWLCEYLPPIKHSVDHWGIPRWVANEMGSRIPIIQYINHRCFEPRIHLLGTSHDQQDDLRCIKLPNVVGIDSANPLVMGFAGRMLEVGHVYGHLPRKNYFDREQLTGCVESNVRWMHNACN